MSESKLMPVSWIRDGRTVYALNEQGVNRFSFHIQGGFVWQTRTSGERTTDSELDAVTQLASAAPDLLAACQAALATHSCENSEPGLPTLQEVYDLLRAAIAKAEGRDE